MYYTIKVAFCEERNGIYQYLPFSSPVTTDLQKALDYFEYELKAYTKEWRSNELIYDVPRNPYYYLGSRRDALIKCNEPAYVNGYYRLNLIECYINPHD